MHRRLSFFLCISLTFASPTAFTASCLAVDALDQQVANQTPFLVVLGVAQDGGYPQAGCSRECCRPAWEHSEQRRFVSCVAVVDPLLDQRFMFDCTPDFRDQLRLLESVTSGERHAEHSAPPARVGPVLNGILPTHAHVGHYTGLMHLGREVMGARSVPVYAMPRMKFFLESNGPWSQLLELNQIQVHRLAAGTPIQLNANIRTTPILVPHRDEFSETVGFIIEGPNRSVLYLPDIDKWERWEVEIESVIAQVDVAYVDGTFFDSGELPGRDMSEIPHPFVAESMQRFRDLPSEQRSKIHFIHFNHSNPLLRESRQVMERLEKSGMQAARQGEMVDL